jgi:hypothetical protein
MRALAEWGIALIGFTVLAYLPLILQGLFDDFLRGIAFVSPAGSYGHRSPADRLESLMRQIRTTTIAGPPLGILLLLPRSGHSTIRRATTWLVVMGMSLLYMPVAPATHDYQLHPLHLVLSVNIAILAHLILRAPAVRPEYNLALLLVLVSPYFSKPVYCSVRATAERLPGLVRGQWPAAMPWRFPSPYEDRTNYPELIDYLRRSTDKTMRIADLRLSVEPVCGVVGRLSPFPIDEASLVWIRNLSGKAIPMTTEREYIPYLERTPNSIVVWEPSKSLKGEYFGPRREPFEYRELAETVRRLYEPEARFGPIEVWRRRSAAAE